jgi:uncharacterized protein
MKHSISTTASRLLFLVIAGMLVACSTPTSKTESSTCIPGTYKKGAETVVVYRRESDPESRVRYTFVDGRRGVIDLEAEVSSCLDGHYWALEFEGFEQVRFDEQDGLAIGEGAALATRYISPRDVSGSRPLALFVHGSESTPTVGWSPYPYLFAAQGVDVMVYDKRGTGASTGTYTQDFHILADDAAIVAVQARRAGGDKISRFGYFGGSQGGWVAPLAASRTGADFLVVGFGLVLSPLEEDAEQVFDELRRAGYGEDTLSEARQLTDATGRVVASGFTDGVGDLISIRLEYEHEPWFSLIEGEFTGDLLGAPESDLRRGRAGDFEDTGTSWRYDALATLKSLDMPQLWILAGSDRNAPGKVTQQRLRLLQDEGKPVTIAVYPDTDHGIVEFTEDENGQRTYTRFAEGYLRLAVDGMKGDWQARYGQAVFERPLEVKP